MVPLEGNIMTGSEPKEGGGFELFAAAALKFESQSTDGKKIDLTKYNFNPVPKTYPSTLTNAGYDITVDISAHSIEDNLEYAIECKSSIHRDNILDEKSDQFLSGMLEFLALERFVEITRWRFSYVLAANFPISRKIASFIKKRSISQLKVIRNTVIKYGKKEKKGFKPSIASINRIGKVLSNLTLIELPDQYINKLKQNPDYIKLYDGFSEQLKKIRLNVIFEDSGSVLKLERVQFLCSDSDHTNCEDFLINDTVCHLGKVPELIEKITFLGENLTAIKIIRITDLGYSVKDISCPNVFSTLKVAEVISGALNKRMKLNCLIYVVPGTFDLILVNTEKMIASIKKSLDTRKMKYILDEVPELAGLGETIKVSLAQSIFAFYHIKINESEFLTAE